MNKEDREFTKFAKSRIRDAALEILDARADQLPIITLIVECVGLAATQALGHGMSADEFEYLCRDIFAACEEFRSETTAVQ